MACPSSSKAANVTIRFSVLLLDHRRVNEHKPAEPLPRYYFLSLSPTDSYIIVTHISSSSSPVHRQVKFRELTRLFSVNGKQRGTDLPYSLKFRQRRGAFFDCCFEEGQTRSE